MGEKWNIFARIFFIEFFNPRKYGLVHIISWQLFAIAGILVVSNGIFSV